MFAWYLCNFALHLPQIFRHIYQRYTLNWANFILCTPTVQVYTRAGLLATPLLLFCLTALPVRAQELGYGATELLGPSLEACVSEATVANPMVLSPSDEWDEALINAQPGATLLLRAGAYQASNKLWLPAGAPEQFITVKPYNCEQVILYASLRPLSYTIIAGLTVEAKELADMNYVIRIDSEYKGAYWGKIT